MAPTLTQLQKKQTQMLLVSHRARTQANSMTNRPKKQTFTAIHTPQLQKRLRA